MALPNKALLALALTASFVTAESQAQQPSPFNRSITVHFSDLNLSSPEGTRALYGRIRRAAQTVCGTRLSVWDHSRVEAWKQCYRATIDDAVRRIDRPLLTSLHHQSKAPPG